MARVYFQSVTKWAKEQKIKIYTTIGLIFAFLIAFNMIEVISYSDSMACTGEDWEHACEFNITFKANEDIFLYQLGYDPWGRDTFIEFEPGVKDWKFYRTWGKGLREIPLDKGCTGTWCGKPKSDTRDEATYSYAFRKGKIYTIVVKALKNNREDIIKWTALDGKIDPYFWGIDENGNVLKEEQGLFTINEEWKVKGDASKYDITFEDIKDKNTTITIKAKDSKNKNNIELTDKKAKSQKSIKQDKDGNYVTDCKSGICEFNPTLEFVKSFIIQDSRVVVESSYYMEIDGNYTPIVDDYWYTDNGKHGVNTTNFENEYQLGKIEYVFNKPFKFDGDSKLMVKTGITTMHDEYFTVDNKDLYNYTINVTSSTTAEVYFVWINGTADPTVSNVNLSKGYNNGTLSGNTIVPDLKINRTDLIAYYTFDTDALGETTCTDNSGNGNSGTMRTPTNPGIAPANSSFGNGRRYLHDGVDTNTNGCQIASDNFQVGNFTIYADVDIINGNGFFFTSGSFNNAFGMKFATWPTVVAFGLTDSESIHSSYTNNRGVHKFFGLYNGTHLCMYAENKILDCDASTGTVATSTGGAYIGAFNNVDILNGSLDNLIIWNRSLSINEMDNILDGSLYNESQGQYYTEVEKISAYQVNNASLYLSMDNNISTDFIDESGLNNNGTAQNGVEQVIGLFGKAVKFDGTNDRAILVNISNGLDINKSNALTVSTWIKFDVLDSVWYGIIAQQANSGDWPPWVLRRPNSGYFSFCLTDNQDCSDNGVDDTRSTFKPVINTWYHVVGRYNGTHNSIFVNGILETSKNHSGIIPYSKDLSIGTNYYSNAINDELKGSLDEIMIWNRSLSDSEIKQIYEASAYFNYTENPVLNKLNLSINVSCEGLTCPNVSVGYKNFTWMEGLVSYHDFDGTNLPIVKDLAKDNDIVCDSGVDLVDGYFERGTYYSTTSEKCIGDNTDTLDSIIDTDEFTIATWINISGGNQFVIRYKEIAVIIYGFTANTYETFSCGGSVRYTLGSATNGEWQHIAVSYDRDGRCYGMQNGTIITNTTCNCDLVTTGNNLLIGNTVGNIDEVMFWNRSLSPEEINEVYEWTSWQYTEPQTSTNGEQVLTFNISNTSNFIQTKIDLNANATNTNIIYEPLTMTSFFENATPPAPTCVTPVDDLVITEDTTLCSGTYYLNDTANDGLIKVATNGITLNCNNAIIIGNGTGRGITRTTGYNDVTIENCTLQNYDIGIRLEAGNRWNITNNIISSNQYGIFSSISNSIFKNNNIYGGLSSGGEYSGIYLFVSESGNIKILNNNISDYVHSIRVKSGVNYTIINNNIMSNSSDTSVWIEENSKFNNLTNNFDYLAGWNCYANNADFSYNINNYAEDCEHHAFDVWEATNSQLINNTFIKILEADMSGILIRNTSNSIFSGNNFTNVDTYNFYLDGILNKNNSLINNIYYDGKSIIYSAYTINSTINESSSIEHYITFPNSATYNFSYNGLKEININNNTATVTVPTGSETYTLSTGEDWKLYATGNGCTLPQDDASYTTDTLLCKGQYYLDDTAGDGIIQIGASGITLDGDGAILIGDDISPAYAIYSINKNYLTIKNLIVQKYSSNIFIQGATYLNITNVVSHDAQGGENLFLAASQNVLITNYTAYDADGIHGNHGIYVSSNFGVTKAENITITKSYLYNNLNSGLHINSKFGNNRVTNLKVYDNIISGNGVGITDFGSYNSKIYNNNISNSANLIQVQQDPVFQNGSLNTTYTNNTLLNQSNAHFLLSYGSSATKIINNIYDVDAIIKVRNNVSISEVSFAINETTNLIIEYDNIYSNPSSATYNFSYNGLKEININNNTATVTVPTGSETYTLSSGEDWKLYATGNGCVLPQDDASYTTDTLLCKGQYHNLSLIISGNNMVFDCSGSKFIGKDTGRGIDTTGQDNYTIKNCNIKDYYFGIDLITNAEINNNFIINNTVVEGCEQVNIYIGASKNFILDNITSKYSENSHGLYIDALIGIHRSENGTIMNSNFSNNANSGIQFNSANVARVKNITVDNCILKNNSGSGINDLSSDTNLYTNNIFEDNIIADITFDHNEAGGSAYGAYNTTATGNTFVDRNALSNIRFGNYSSENTVRDNTYTLAPYFIYEYHVLGHVNETTSGEVIAYLSNNAIINYTFNGRKDFTIENITINSRQTEYNAITNVTPNTNAYLVTDPFTTTLSTGQEILFYIGGFLCTNGIACDIDCSTVTEITDNFYGTILRFLGVGEVKISSNLTYDKIGADSGCKVGKG